MNIWSKVFIVLIVLLGVASVIWSAKELNVQRQYREAIAKKEAEIAKKNEQIAKLTLSSKPTTDPAGRMPSDLVVGELAAKVELMLRERNRAWFGCQPGAIKPSGKTVPPTLPRQGNQQPLPLTSVDIASSEPLDARGIVYVFSEGSLFGADSSEVAASGVAGVAAGERGVFLGRFSIDGPPKDAGDGTFTSTLTSIDVLNQREQDQLNAAKSTTWAVYISMPTDRVLELYDAANPENKPLLFDQLKEEELAKLPPDVRALLLQNDRAVRGFEYLVAGAYQQRVILNQTIDTLKRNIKDLEDAQTKLDAEIKKSTDDTDFEKRRVDAMRAQYNTIQSVYDRTQVLVDQMQGEIDTLQIQNEKTVDGIGDAQQKATSAVDIKPE